MSDIERLAAALLAEGLGARLLRDEPMARHTSFAIGGPADLLVVAETPEEMVHWRALAGEHAAPCVVIGGGTNILVADRGIRGLVIVNGCHRWRIEADGLLVAESGVRFWDLARGAMAQGWGGLEWAVGVPGSLGGAVVGNAGAYGGSLSDILQWVDVASLDGDVLRLGVAALDYGYRTSALKRVTETAQRPIVLRAALQLCAADAAELAARAAEFTRQRLERTPAGCCAGSIFKKTLQYPAGFLVEQAGLKGVRLGGAIVSPKHANFIMNEGGATAADVRALVEQVQRAVQSAFGQRLEPEIEFLGEWEV